MLDAKVTPFIKPLLKPLIKALDSKGVTPNQVTLAGFVIGVLALPFIILNWWKCLSSSGLLLTMLVLALLPLDEG